MSIKNVQKIVVLWPLSCSSLDRNTTVSDRVQKEGLKSDANDTSQYQYNIVSYCPSATCWPSKTRCFEVFVCQLGALVGRDQARVEVITSSRD